MKIKTTLKYQLTPVRMAIIKMSTNNKCWRGCEDKRTLLHCWWECKFIHPPWIIVCRFCKKLKIELPYDSAIPILGIYPEKTIIQKDTCILVLTVTLFTIAKSWKQPKCPSTDEQIKKVRYIYTMGYYSVIKRNEVGLLVVMWMDLESIIQNEVSQEEKNISHVNAYIWLDKWYR